MTLWGCRLGLDFAACAAAEYSFSQLIMVAVVAGIVASALVYYGVRFFSRIFR